MRNKFLGSGFGIAGAALGIRVSAAVYYYGFGGYSLSGIWNMGYEMAHAAANLANGQGFSSPFQVATGPTAALPPGYPGLLSVIFRLFGTMLLASAWVAVGLNLVFSAATGLVIFYLAKKTLGENAAVIAAWIGALYPPVILSSVFHVRDTSLTILLAAVACLLATYLVTGDWKTWLLHGTLWGIGALVNPALLTIYGVLFAWAWWRRQRHRMAWHRNAAVAVVVLVAMIGPSAARNYRVFHRVVPVRTNFGLELWVGNHEGADGFFRVLLHPLARGRDAAVPQARRRRLHGMEAALGGGVYGTASGRIPAADPLPHELLLGRRVRLGIRGDRTAHNAAGVMGTFLLARHDRELMWMYALPLIFYPLPYYLTHADLRFRLPAEPLLACLTGYAVTTIAGQVRQSRTESTFGISSVVARHRQRRAAE